MRRWSRTKRRVFIALMIFIGALLVDSIWYEPRHPVLTIQHVALAGLPRSMDGFRVVQLSDVHRRLIVPDVTIRRAVALANSTHPDVVVLTGDYESRHTEDIEPCFDMLAKLKASHGRFAVLGNHDHWTGPQAVADSIERHGITLLNNSNRKLGPNTYLCGIDDLRFGHPNAGAALSGIPDGSALIALSHDPDGIEIFRSRKCLLLSGHTHGGQIQLPLPGNWRYPGLRRFHYRCGWYRLEGVRMYVNRGIGMINPGVRFLCRPEVTLFVIHPKT